MQSKAAEYPSFVKRVIAALDVEMKNPGDAKRWLLPWKAIPFAGVKIGLQAFTQGGPELVHLVQKTGFAVFLDLKFHDIPHTVAAAATAASQLGVWMLTVHVAGGEKMLHACCEGAKKKSGATPLVMGVTVLTSQETTLEEVVSRARLAKQSGCDGVIASAHEIQEIRQECGSDFLVATPGIRFQKEQVDDQKRVATPHEAISWGADYLVLGRPILELKDPQAFLKNVPA